MTLDLDAALERPPCPGCRIGRIRVEDVVDGGWLRFGCSIPQCAWRRSAKLPTVRKTIVYLDTAVVSNMCKARAGGDATAPYARLLAAVNDAIAHEAICCPASPIVRQEAELDTDGGAFIDLSQGLADPGCKHRRDVVSSQVLRALGQWLNGDPPTAGSPTPAADAFRRDPHRWLSGWEVAARSAPAKAELSSRRADKQTLRDQLDQIYREYADGRMTFDAIVRHEAATFGRALWRIGIDRIRNLAKCQLGEIEFAVSMVDLTVLDQIIWEMMARGSDWRRAVRDAGVFLHSDHVALLPVAQVSARLHAGIARASRGLMARNVRPSDPVDVDHFSTYAPYVDIFTADAFFAGLCRTTQLLLPSTEVIAVAKDIEAFTARVRAIAAAAPQRALAARIRAARQAGGYADDLLRRLGGALAARRQATRG